jgi:hypothetical protein
MAWSESVVTASPRLSGFISGSVRFDRVGPFWR